MDNLKAVLAQVCRIFSAVQSLLQWLKDRCTRT